MPENSSIIARGAADLAYRRIAPELSHYMGGVFEEICKQYLWMQLLNSSCPVNFSDLGRWWGTNPQTRQQEEIDIMGIDKDSALFGECKWSNEKVDTGVLEKLISRGELLPYPYKHYYLFAKSGFTKGCEKAAAEIKDVHLVAFDEMI